VTTSVTPSNIAESAAVLDELAATAVTGRPNGLVLLRRERERFMWRLWRFANTRRTK